jgi:mono/diheme cytochrome c family protein
LKIFLVVIFLVSGFVATEAQKPALSTAKAKEAKKLFKLRCAKCHGTDGAGDSPYGKIVGATNLRDPKWQEKVDDDRLMNSIKHGRGQMPGFNKKLTDDQIDSLALFVRTLRSKSTPSE